MSNARYFKGYVVVSEVELNALQTDVESYVKQALAAQLGKSIAESEIGQQRFTREGEAMWTQAIAVMSHEDYLALYNKAHNGDKP